MSDSKYQSPFNPLVTEKPGEINFWGRLHGCSKALAISQYARNKESMVVVLTRDMPSAAQLLHDLEFFLHAEADPEILTFPDWETLPYDLFSPFQDIISDRLAALSRLPAMSRGILVVPVTTVMHRLLPRDYLLRQSLVLEQGQKLELHTFRQEMQSAGYTVTDQVIEHGDMAIRGSLIDIYPMGARLPLRIDLFDDDVDSLRYFNPENQRSLETIDSVKILPAREIALVDEGIARFRSAWRERFAGNPSNCPVYRDVSQGLAPAGIEYYLPLFFSETSTLFDYLDDNTTVFMDENITDTAEEFWQDIESRYEQGRHDVERPLLPPRDVFLNPHDLLTRIKPFARVGVTAMAQETNAHAINFATTIPTRLPIDARSGQPFGVLQRYMQKFNGRILIAAESSGRRETLLDMFRQQDLGPTQFPDWQSFLQSGEELGLTVAPLDEGVQIDDPPLAIISESQLFGERAQQRRLRRRRQQDTDAVIRNLTELTEGAPVVHEDHGVGRYRGLVTLQIDNMPAEFICIEYDQGDKLYVPVSSLELVSRYTGVDPEHAPLHRLGSGHWEKARQRAAKRARDVAVELLDLHARRAARAGQSFSIDDNEYQAFCQSFPFEETPGQADAIDSVLDDLRQPKPMDRLVCGDSGFGKTEVAMRAAFVTVQNSKQVAILVPTTLLAQQHYQNFRDRFADWPVRIESLSRFRSQKDQEKVLAGMREGKVDIVIGTHKLLQSDVNFKRLGLLIIDEEHRFGVRQKEKFKALRTEIDVLTLTATPIPRTLNMALSDLRELSVIATPPSRRLAVKTFVRQWSDAVLREAMLREIKRGGQVYFLHNKVEDIDSIARQVEKLMPEARVNVAHGQMPEKQLEQVMLDFYHRRFNVLICTTIIETGIDVPSANTIIINRADKFGLAQLYQLRGRVGRSHHRAYAYLVVPPQRAMTRDAIKRLEAIESLEELGIGFTLATHDLEIRGAGEILGEEQSGQIQEVGFGMYMELLERAVRALKSGKQPELDRPLEHGAEIDMHIPALIPEDYLPDVHTRLIIYKRLASCENDEQLTDLQEEIIDRFGLMPEYLKNLVRVSGLKMKANRLGVRKVDLGPHGGRIRFNDNANIDPASVIKLIQLQPSNFKLDGQYKLQIINDLPEADDRFRMLDTLLDQISTRNAA